VALPSERERIPQNDSSKRVLFGWADVVLVPEAGGDEDRVSTLALLPGTGSREGPWRSPKRCVSAQGENGWGVVATAKPTNRGRGGEGLDA